MEYVEMCVAHDLFTNGDNAQYCEVINYYKDLKRMKKVNLTQTEVLVYMTWICSDVSEFTVNDIREIIKHSLNFNE